MEELTAHLVHVLSQDFVSLWKLSNALELLRAKIRLLWHFAREFSSAFLLLSTLDLDARDDTHPDLAVGKAFDEANVIFVGSTLFNPYPLVRADVVLLGFVVLID